MTKQQDFHMRPIRGRYQGIPGVFFATSDIQVSFLQKMIFRWSTALFPDYFKYIHYIHSALAYVA